ncbi:MAG: HAD-IB family hydrolase, partial [Bacteroidia bacterium]|nr:HAD-IB family hydrolase [Bacteroidia bacterium]
MEELINDKRFLDNLRLISNNLNIEFDDAVKEARIYLEEMYTDQHPIVRSIGVRLAQFILERGYEKTIDVNEAEIKALAKLMRRHPVAFVMTHKTYIDMFVLGVTLAQYGLPIPFIFGGINMSFLGMKEIGKRSGAIFIRRSFKENFIYKACLRHFIKSIVDKGQHFMWAIEGTRSRTGKLVWPKMGILKYIMEADQASRKDVKYIPVSIVYDLIPDVDEMTKEARGKQKSQESLMWFINYIRKMDNKMGKISIRFGEPTEIESSDNASNPETVIVNKKPQISKFAFEILHDINKVTPVTTSSLICTALLSKFALTKKAVEQNVIELMEMIENHKSDTLVSRGQSISQSIQSSLNLLSQSNVVQQIGNGLTAKFSIVPENYLTATYYSNMAVHHLYHRAFIEVALAKIHVDKSENRIFDFWQSIMALRDQFKFEFFYSNKANFSDEIEIELNFLNPNWEKILMSPKKDPLSILKGQKMVMSQVVLSTYIEAYKVVAKALQTLDPKRKYEDNQLLTTCLFVGEEMHWKGEIHRVESVSKPFITNGIRLAKNRNAIPSGKDRKIKKLKQWYKELDEMSNIIRVIQDYTSQVTDTKAIIPINRNIVPGTKAVGLTEQILNGEKGSHIGAFFDLDKTLISGFSAKEFFATRLTSGKMTPKEILAQLSGVLVYAKGKKDFAGLAAISAKGVKGIKEEAFIKIGEEVYMKHLSNSIYPESRALVDAHLSMGHTVAIVSAATPYQVKPIARDLGIDHIMCTEMELEDDTFTGNIVDPPCWGEGKAKAGVLLSEKHNLDLKKSHFYTDSIEDLPLLEIVGHPHPINPDAELSRIAFENDWPIHRFEEIERPSFLNIIRTGLTFGS